MRTHSRKFRFCAIVVAIGAGIGLARVYWIGPRHAAASHIAIHAEHRGAGGVGRTTHPNVFEPMATSVPSRPDIFQPSTAPETEPSTASSSQAAASAPPVEPILSLFQRNTLTGDWLGVRPKLENHGLSIAGTLTTTYDKTLQGGVDTVGNTGGYIFSLEFTLDTQKMFNLSGGMFFLNVQSMDGRTNSLDGAVQTTTLAYRPQRNQISELWYEQKLLGDELRLKLGKIDANTEFAFVSNGSEFVNSSMSFSPTIRDFPTDPDPAIGAVAFLYPTKYLYAGAGAFDGSLHNAVSTGSFGPASLFHRSPGYFLIGEAGASWTTAASQDGRIGIGVWDHTGRYARFDGGTNNGTSGYYVVIDQALWHKESGSSADIRGISGFFQYGYADPSDNAVTHHVGGGLTWTGAIPGRDGDIIGVGPTWADFSNATASGFDHRGELVVESFYKIVLTPWLSIKPDVQFISNPGGLRGSHDTVVASVQGLIVF